jgi:hypothetical protein
VHGILTAVNVYISLIFMYSTIHRISGKERLSTSNDIYKSTMLYIIQIFEYTSFVFTSIIYGGRGHLTIFLIFSLVAKFRKLGRRVLDVCRLHKDLYLNV